MQVIAIVNQKGGVGKTTTTCNLGAALADLGRRILLVDLDAQAHLTFHLGVDNSTLETSMYDVMTGRASVAEALIHRGERLHLVPSHIDLAGAEIELVTQLARERILHDALAACRDDYDYVLIDCPPSLGLMTLNALVAANDILITLQPHVLALQGISKLLETAALVHDRLNSRLHIMGVVFCMFDGRTTLSSEVLADVSGYFSRAAEGQSLMRNTRVYETRIRRNIKLAEAPGFGQTILEYDASSHGAEDYRQLADEFLGNQRTETETNKPAAQLAAEVLPQDEPESAAEAPSPEIQPAAPSPENSTSSAEPPQAERLAASAETPCSDGEGSQALDAAPPIGQEQQTAAREDSSHGPMAV
ncbi:MAG: AAA family ATPase [Planctomycetes bacterium]|nr:AAA family ATPase [Planctomycetota bacterium]